MPTATFRPIFLPFKGSSTTRIQVLYVSCRRSEIQEIGLSIYIIDRFLVVISTQLIGYSIGGVCKSFLVDPPSMIWPGTLVNAALFNTIHSLETAGAQGRGGISRARFFTYVFVAYFFYSEFVSPDLLDSCRSLTSPRFLAFLFVYRSVQLLVGLLDRTE